jgi:hypothetical protein
MRVRLVRRGGEMCVRFVPGRAGGVDARPLGTARGRDVRPVCTREGGGCCTQGAPHLFSIARSPDCSSPAGSAASAARTPARAAPHSAQHGQPATVLRDAPALTDLGRRAGSRSSRALVKLVKRTWSKGQRGAPVGVERQARGVGAGRELEGPRERRPGGRGALGERGRRRARVAHACGARGRVTRRGASRARWPGSRPREQPGTQRFGPRCDLCSLRGSPGRGAARGAAKSRAQRAPRARPGAAAASRAPW